MHDSLTINDWDQDDLMKSIKLGTKIAKQLQLNLSHKHQPFTLNTLNGIFSIKRNTGILVNLMKAKETIISHDSLGSTFNELFKTSKYCFLLIPKITHFIGMFQYMRKIYFIDIHGRIQKKVFLISNSNLLI